MPLCVEQFSFPVTEFSRLVLKFRPFDFFDYSKKKWEKPITARAESKNLKSIMVSFLLFSLKRP